MILGIYVVLGGRSGVLAASCKYTYVFPMVVNEPKRMSFMAEIANGERVVSRFIDDGVNGWKATNRAIGYAGDQVVKENMVYSRVGDYTVGGKWVYVDTAGQTRELICGDCLSVYNKEYVNLGTIRVGGNQSYDGVVSVGGKYIGLIDGGSASGSNGGATSISGSWKVLIDGAVKWGYFTGGDYWVSPQDYVLRYTPGNREALSTMVGYKIVSPVFTGGQAYADFNFGRIMVYTRSFQRKSFCGVYPNQAIDFGGFGNRAIMPKNLPTIMPPVAL